MGDRDDAFDPEELLQHAGWMKALALSLVHDEGQADDLVQDTFLAAIAHPPRHHEAAGAWLRTVLRNRASRKRREDLHRRARETAAARPEAASPSPEEILEGVEMQHKIVELVLELDEPLRSTVLFSYFAELEHEEIARRDGISITTVRWRLRRALDILRRRLDRIFGNRQAWCLALLPLVMAEGLRVPTAGAGPSAASSAPAASVPSAATTVSTWIILGAGAVKLKAAAIACILAILLLGSFFWITRKGDSPPHMPIAGIASAPGTGAPVKPDPSGADPGAPPESPTTSGPEAGGPPSPEGAGAIAISGTVVEEETGEPIPGAAVKVRESRTTVLTDEEGAYKIEGLKAGSFAVVASSEGHAEKVARVNSGGLDAIELDFQLDRAVDLHVKVEDAAGRPLEGVEVTPSQRSSDYVYGEEYTRITGPDGKVVISGISRSRPQQINARKQGYQEVWTQDFRIEPDADAAELRIVMKDNRLQEWAIVGHVKDPNGRGLPGIRVQWIHSHGPERGQAIVSTDAGGFYRLQFPSDRTHCTVTAFAPGWAPAVKLYLTPGTPSEPAVVDFMLERGHWLEGEVVDESDRPVEKVKVKVMPSLETLRNPTTHPNLLRSTHTDAQGRFRLDDLTGPAVTVQLEPPAAEGLPGTNWSHNIKVDVPVDGTARLVLERFGVIRGRVVDGESGEPVPLFAVKLRKGAGYWDYPRQNPGESFHSPQGEFTLRDLDRGVFEISVEADGYAPSVVGELTAVPLEKEEWNEIRLARMTSLEVMVVDALTGSPLAGIRVVGGTWKMPRGYSWEPSSWKDFLRDRKDLVTGEEGTVRLPETEPGVLFIQGGPYARLCVPPEGRKAFTEADGRLRIPLEKGASLSGRLLLQGKPSPEGRLMILYQTSDDQQPTAISENLARDPEGRFRLEGLPAGTYVAQLWRETEGDRNNPRIYVHRPIHLDGQDLEVDLGGDAGTLSFGGRILGAGKSGPEFVTIALKPEFEWEYTAISQSFVEMEDGGLRFNFLGLKRGKYHLYVTSDRKGLEEEIDLSADQEKDFDLEAMGR